MSNLFIWPVSTFGIIIAAGIFLPTAGQIWLNRAALAVLGASLVSLWLHLWSAPDMLAFWFYTIVAVLSFFGLWYSEPYLKEETRLHHWSSSKVKSYSVLLWAFVASLLAIALWTNFLFLWVGIEAATLTSVFLTGAPGDSRSTEAAWKYLVVTEAGGFAAFLGTILVLESTGRSLGQWAYTPAVIHVPAGAGHWALLGGLLALIGYSTKAGLAPFHTWLPDAHSEAPAPVSALLSGLKLAGAMIIAYRLFLLLSSTLNILWLKDALIGLGLASLALSAGFVAFQSDLKRLWAYSSIEHIGLIALGMGFGGIALVGAILHIWTHAVSKTLLFHNAGTVRLLYHTSRQDEGAKGLFHRTPWTGGLLALGAMAIAGLPPFAPFWSEWLILAGGFQSSANRVPVMIALGLLVVIFAGISKRLPGWLWTPGSSVEANRPPKHREPWPLLAPSLVLALLVIGGGIGLPAANPPAWHHLVIQLIHQPL